MYQRIQNRKLIYEDLKKNKIELKWLTPPSQDDLAKCEFIKKNERNSKQSNNY